MVGVDFIPSLPKAKNGYDSICAMSCHFSKLVHLIPCKTDITAPDFAKLFRREFFRLHGLPMSIVSDRGGQFVSGFWEEFTKLLGVKT
jgi:hypothetical protein